VTSIPNDREQMVGRWADRSLVIFLAGLGVASIVLSFLYSIPQPQDLVEVHGHLQSYRVPYRCRRCSQRIDIKTEAGWCYTFAISKQRARELLRERGTPVEYCVDTASRHSIDGIPAAYGLSVNHVQIQSPMAALAEESGKAHGGARFCGAFFITIALALFLHSRHQQRLTDR